MVEPVQQFDVISMGRIGVDLHPLQSGVGPARMEAFGKSLGGSAANVAVAAARLGRTAALISRTGADPFGTYLHQTLTDFGVDTRWVTPVESSPTHPKAPELDIHSDELDYFAIRAARLFWITGTGLSGEPSRSATLAALKCRDRASITVFDLDQPLRDGTARPDTDEARPYYSEALRHATVAVGDLDECEIATGVREPRACAEALLAAGVELAVVKQGPGGVLAVHRDDTTAEGGCPGADHAFGGALCHGLLSGWELERTIRYATAAGAHVATRLAASPAMPTQTEADGLLNGIAP